MPVIDVTYPAGALNAQAQEAVAAQLTDILMEIEGTKGDPRIAAGTWLVMHEAEANRIAVGGKFAPGRYQVRVSVPAGGLKVEQKEQLISRVTDAILRIEGVEADDRQRARVYCLVDEVVDGGWGFAGQQFTREKLKALRAGQATPTA